MKCVSTVLRALARIIETAPEECGWVEYLPSRYICDNLLGSCSGLILPGFTDEERERAAEYLHYLGMGRGMSEFTPYYELGSQGGPSNHAERQMLRRMWLEFAADLWDEGVRP